MMDARLKEGLTRSESMNAFEKLKEDVQQWLKRMESRIDALQPVAVDQKLLKDQSDELKVSRNLDGALRYSKAAPECLPVTCCSHTASSLPLQIHASAAM